MSGSDNAAAGHRNCCMLHILQSNCESTAIFVQVAELWQSSFRLTEVGQAAVEKARGWTEAANAAALLSFVQCTKCAFKAT